MKKTELSLLMLALILSFAFGQGFVQTGVAPQYGDNFGGIELLDPANDAASGAGRGIHAGTDLDNDGKFEVFITSYADHKVYGFEETSSGSGTFELVWQSADNTTTGSLPRDIETGDLDNDGNPEIIFFLGQTLGPDNPDAGLQVYEWDGTDNGYGAEPAYRADFYSVLDDSLSTLVVEGFSVGDIDKDGKQELLVANNGPTNPVLGVKNNAHTPYSEDRFMILSIVGNIGDFGTTLVEEFAVSPRDVDKDGTIENGLFGGSPVDMIMCDTDGDGMMEAACSSFNYLALFFIEATGPDAYTLGATTATAPMWFFDQRDAFTLGMSAADMDSDGKDELYVAAWPSPNEAGYRKLFVIKDMDGDATNIDQELDNIDNHTELSLVGDGVENGCVAVPGLGILVGGTAGVSDITLFELAEGGSVLKPSGQESVMGDWTKTVHALSEATSGWAFKISDAFDSDGDGKWEFAVPYQAVLDGIDTDGDGELDAPDPDENRVFRIVEWDENYVDVKDINFIMPDDYKLKQNYPNPFNPTTTISYSLPIQNTISINIYNFLGEHVVTLLDKEKQPAGSHEVVWNSMDKNGNRVPSGTYFYEMKYGNFKQTKQMTLLK